ncbi:MAG TPA: adenosine deaminase [Paracoccus sp. (in: a-proteobacteria)]|uniref:adenosine deaminase n=1 Tax=Paracoccus sp. TaxID=267 RepID=UPI002B72A523|nr:adenosine deaminase [Paracoccus sp. (in: a-proteobacteria)]HWL58035.1 adenosine deaminase [Paracoccus sp. (in: a-proteobacteria)]
MKSLKKVELHLHLEGAAPPAFIRGLASEKREDLSGLFDERGGYAYRDFRDFLRVYEAATGILSGPSDYARLLSAVLSECGEQGAIYVELFVSPEFCGRGDLGAWRDHVAAMEEVARAYALSGVESRAVATCIRHLGPDRARKTALCAAETAGGWVAGLGLAGAEDVGEAGDFAWAFDCAREAGLGLTAHAGEWCGPASVRAALDLGVTRIGHGIRAAEDPALLRDLAEQGVTLEVCPGSNVALGVVRDWKSHPIARLADAGVRVTVSTDDPPFFRTTLGREYEMLAETFGWAESEFRQMNIWAVEAAFCDAATRDRLKQELTI